MKMFSSLYGVRLAFQSREIRTFFEQVYRKKST